LGCHTATSYTKILFVFIFLVLLYWFKLGIASVQHSNIHTTYDSLKNRVALCKFVHLV
jgi:hypothetical protein